jgi:SAM-dependent methyltransferase
VKKIIDQLHKSKFLGAIFHTLDYCLQKELADCESVLDLGCGPSSPLQYCKNIKHSIGVEAFPPYLKEAQRQGTHTEYLAKKIEDLDFPERSFDAIILIEVVEHLPEQVGLEIIKKAEKWAKKKVVLSSPNGFVAQKEVDNNPWQKHLSGWDLAKMQRLGYQSHGLAGLKFLRQEALKDTMGDDLLTSIRFRPKIFWFALATASQLITYFIPSLAFELFSVKKIA